MRRSSATGGYRRSGTLILILTAAAGGGFVAWRTSESPTSTDGARMAVTARAADSLHASGGAAKPRTEVPMMARAAPDAAADAGALSPATPQAAGLALLAQARAARDRGDLLAARGDFSAALNRGLPPDVAPVVRQELAGLAERTLFSRAFGAGDPLIVRHHVASGETLARIAARCRVPEDFIAKLNGLNNKHHIRAGMVLRVVEGPFRVVVEKSAFRLDVYLKDTFIRSFSVGLGTNGSTPTGTWRVVGKLKNPSWNDPRTGRRYAADDPTNPIGEHWIGLEGRTGDAVGKIGFGVHGTTDPGSIGHNASLGCVRMLPEDVAQVYEWLVEGHSTVEVR